MAVRKVPEAEIDMGVISSIAQTYYASKVFNDGFGSTPNIQVRSECVFCRSK